MPDQRAERLAEIVKCAVECEPEGRAAFLDEQCGNDPLLRADIESLLREEDGAGQFLEMPALHLAAESFVGEGAFTAGQVVGGYKILSLVGAGGMGDVYLAEDLQLRRKVALKLVRAAMRTDDIVARFRQEEEILASLNDPNIAHLYGGGRTADGVPFFVMEYVEGLRIDEYCDRHHLPTAARLQLFRKVCSAVQYAHQHLIIHRDLKPSNILVTEAGEPKLLDFGIAKLLKADDTAPAVTLLGVMTPEYASPEQVRGEAITTASDVYSLGVVLYALLTGQSPYRTKTNRPDEVARAITDQDPERPSTAAARVQTSNREVRTSKFFKGDLDNVALMALRKEPSRRYTSAGQFSEDIRRYLAGLPVIARKDTFGYRASKFIARNKVGVAAAALFLVAIVAGLTVSIWQARAATRERDQARRKTEQAEQLNKFLQSILSAASPEERGKDATVIQVLDDAAERIATEFATEPALKAQALMTIGRSYTLLGLTEKAEKPLRGALEINLRLYGQNDSATTSSMIGLAETLLAKARNDEAEKLLTKGIALERQLSPGGSKILARALFLLGELENRRAAYDRARSHLQESIAMSDSFSGEGNEDSAFTLISLGRVEQFSGDWTAAEATYRRSIVIFRKLPQRFELRMATALVNLGELLGTLGNYDEGISALREADGIFQKQGDSEYLCASRMYLCKAFWKKEDYEPAIDAGTKGVELGRKLHAEGLPDFIYTLEYLGMSLTRTGRAIEAEPLVREALTRAEKDFPKGDWRIAVAEGTLGECLTGLGQFGEAEPLIVRSYEDLKKAHESRPPNTAAIHRDPVEKWMTLAAKRGIELYEKWNKPEMAARYRAVP